MLLAVAWAPSACAHSPAPLAAEPQTPLRPATAPARPPVGRPSPSGEWSNPGGTAIQVNLKLDEPLFDPLGTLPEVRARLSRSLRLAFHSCPDARVVESAGSPSIEVDFGKGCAVGDTPLGGRLSLHLTREHPSPDARGSPITIEVVASQLVIGQAKVEAPRLQLVTSDGQQLRLEARDGIHLWIKSGSSVSYEPWTERAGEPIPDLYLPKDPLLRALFWMLRSLASPQR